MSKNLKSLKYTDNYDLPENSFRISPSMVFQFYYNKTNWFRSQVLGEELFKGNTSTILGTCIHRVAEEFIKTKQIDYLGIEEYAKEQSLINSEVDFNFIKDQITPMGEALKSHLEIFGIPDKSEYQVSYEIKKDIYVAGTIDAIIDDCIIDFKTTSDKTPKDYIPMNYKWQLLTYAYICKQLGMNVNRIKIIWVTTNEVGRYSEKTGKALKDYPTQVVPITNLITEDDYKWIDDYLHLIAETIEYYKANTDLAYLLFSDYRLKPRFINIFKEKNEQSN